MRTSRQVAEKLGTVRQDPDLNGLLFILINRATAGRQERAARACRHLTTGEGRGLNIEWGAWRLARGAVPVGTVGGEALGSAAWSENTEQPRHTFVRFDI